MKTLYRLILNEQFSCGWSFSDDAVLYVMNNLDLADEEAVRHVIRHTLVPMFRGTGPRTAEHVKEILQWALNCASDDQLIQLNAVEDWVIGDTDPPRLFFEWWWSELFGDEDWRADGICDAELVGVNPPSELRGVAYQWDERLDPEVLRFPRRDGLPPGHGAPADPNRVRPG